MSSSQIKLIYQEYMEMALFHLELWGIFSRHFFPEADSTIAASPILDHVIFPMHIPSHMQL
jgi:hypothetical protein